MIPTVNNKCIYDSITIIRTVTVLLVIAVQHGFGPYSSSWHFAKAPEPYLDCVGVISIIVNTLTMPTLFFISGYLFSLLYHDKRKYHDYYQLMWTKIKRLLFPAYVFGVIFLFTLTGHIDVKDLMNGACHLWFLPSLFLTFVFTPPLLKINVLVYRFSVVLALFVFIYVPLPEYIGLGGFHRLFFFFYLGVITAVYNHQTLAIIYKFKWLLVCVTVATLLIIVLFDTNSYYQGVFAAVIPNQILALVRNIYKIAAIYLMLYVVTNKVTMGQWKESSIRLLAKTSFGAYVFHMWLMWLFFKLPFTSEYAIYIAETYYYLFPIFYVLVSFSLSTFLTILLQKTRWGRFLLG